MSLVSNRSVLAHTSAQSCFTFCDSIFLLRESNLAISNLQVTESASSFHTTFNSRQIMLHCINKLNMCSILLMASSSQRWRKSSAALDKLCS